MLKKLVSLGLAGYSAVNAMDGEDLDPNLNRYWERDQNLAGLDIGQAWRDIWQKHETARNAGNCPQDNPLGLCVQLCGSQANVAAKNEMVDYTLCRALCMNEDKCEQYGGCPDCEEVRQTWKLACGTGTMWHHGQKECVGVYRPGERGPSFCGKNTVWDGRSEKCVGVSRKDGKAVEQNCGQAKSKVKRGHVALVTHLKTACDCEEYCKTVSKGQFHRAWSFSAGIHSSPWMKADGKSKSKKGKCSCYTGGDRSRIAIVPGKDFAGMLEWDS